MGTALDGEGPLEFEDANLLPTRGRVGVVRVHCTHDPDTRGGTTPPDGRKVKGTLHWVSQRHTLPAEIRLYDTLFSVEDPLDVPEGGSFLDTLNPDSFRRLEGCALEPALGAAEVGSRWQFERQGYFCLDPRSKPGAPVWNRTVTLRDTWAKVKKQAKR